MLSADCWLLFLVEAPGFTPGVREAQRKSDHLWPRKLERRLLSSRLWPARSRRRNAKKKPATHEERPLLRPHPSYPIPRPRRQMLREALLISSRSSGLAAAIGLVLRAYRVLISVSGVTALQPACPATLDYLCRPPAAAIFRFPKLRSYRADFWSCYDIIGRTQKESRMHYVLSGEVCTWRRCKARSNILSW
jgi:hypothetical protein